MDAGRLIRWLVAAGLVLAAGSGCARWSSDAQEKQNWKLPSPKMSPDSVVLEVISVRLTPTNREDAAQAWKEADEQIVDSELRRRLIENGWRCGKVSVQLPVGLQRLIDERPTNLDVNSQDAQRLAEDALARPLRIQSRKGARTALPAGTNQESLNVLINDNGSIRGETFEQAQCMLALRTFPQPDGRVRIELTPEIEFGQPKNRRIGADGMWRLDFSRDRREFEQLRLDVPLAPGETLLVTCGDDRVGLGGTFFQRPRDETMMLLIRLAQTQTDELFHPAEQLTPIASPSDF